MDRKKLIARASRALAADDIGAAKESCSRLLALHPNDLDVLKLNGELCFKTGDVSRGVKLFQQCISLEPKNAEPWLWIAEQFEKVGKGDSAWQALLEGAKRFPQNAAFPLASGELAFSLGEAALAVEQFSAADAIQPLGASASLSLARSLLALHREPEAKDRLRNLIETDQNAEAMTLLGYVFQAEGAFEEARQMFSRAIITNPRETAAYHGYSQGRRFSEADRDFLNSVNDQLTSESIDGKDRMTLEYVAGKIQEDLQEYENAFGHYEKGNQEAFVVNLGGRPFDREAHSAFLADTRAAFPPDSLSLWSPVSRVKPVPFFVVGMMRSGTTLLEQILSAHPQIAGAGELDFWPDRHRAAFDHAKIPSFGEEYSRLLRERFASAEWVIDKMPPNYQSLGAIHLAFPRAPIVHVRRDPRDTCLSIYTTAYSVSPDFAHDLESIRFVYEEYLAMMDYWRTALPPDRLVEIDYEELVSNREKVLREILDRCDIPWSDALLHHETNDRVVTTPSVWQVRQPVNSNSVGRWKKFKSHLGPLDGMSAR